jgi:hypothetical protein
MICCGLKGKSIKPLANQFMLINNLIFNSIYVLNKVRSALFESLLKFY